MAIEIVDLPIKNGGSFHSYVYKRLPEGIACFTNGLYTHNLIYHLFGL